ncbi:adenylate/guanylate cyclase domain-containing protein [Candidatus Poribacteria bacterium]|nr:adenylate/guanylate cyclase domain-containing protein [Candidatus Poribacteria bacterium]
METNINTGLLKENLKTLQNSRSWSDGLVDKLEEFISNSDDYDLFRVNPLRFSIENDISESDGIDLFLWASKLNLFEMNWELLCPACGDHIQSFRHLNTMQDKIFCSLCQCEQIAALDDWIQVTFTINSKIRHIRFHQPENLSINEFIFQYHFTRDAKAYEGGPEKSRLLGTVAKDTAFIARLEKKTFEFDLQDGLLIIYDFLNNRGLNLMISPEISIDGQAVDITYVKNDFEINQPQINSGRVKFTVENKSDSRLALGLFLIPSEIVANMDEDATVIMDPYLDGKKLLTSQTFRDLFRNELIQGNEGINVKDLTVLFTDLKGSTELYDRVGDLKAFNLVNQHFESLAKVIVRNRGAIVKTIGDAVMATFANPLDSVKAATEIVEDLNQFNRQHGGENIIIKIGVHKGSSIAVTLNDRLDYFGQTVNVAARVQGLADAEEIYITDSVYEIEEIQDKISDYTIIPERAKLKGIQEEMDVYKVLIGNSQSTMSI